jgi:hypothetical protein
MQKKQKKKLHDAELGWVMMNVLHAWEMINLWISSEYLKVETIWKTRTYVIVICTREWHLSADEPLNRTASYDTRLKHHSLTHPQSALIVRSQLWMQG